MSSLADYKAFLIENNVLTTAAGITFGQASFQLIKSFVADLMLPLIYMLASAISIAVGRISGGIAFSSPAGMVGGGQAVAGTAAGGGGFLSKVLLQKELKFSNFLAECITYLLVLLTAYMLINSLFRTYLLQKKSGTAAGTPSKQQQAAVDSADAGGDAEGFSEASSPSSVVTRRRHTTWM